MVVVIVRVRSENRIIIIWLIVCIEVLMFMIFVCVFFVVFVIDIK